jgi:hypothetical protein
MSFGRKLLAVSLISVLAVLMGAAVAFGQAAPASDAQTSVSVVYGLRLQSDMLFYATVGVLTQRADAGIGIGLNNSVWVGMHTYFYQDEGLAAFTGLELHVIYPERDTITLKPSFPIGFALTHAQTVTTIATLITPALEGEPVGATFEVSFMMEL